MIDLRCGDCLELMKNIPSNTIDCVITSPPYDNLREYNNNDLWNFDKFKKVAEHLYRVLKSGGIIVWIVSDQTIKGSETGTSFKQALYFKEIGFNIHDTMIWEKPTFTDVASLKVRYAQVFEYMFIFSKGKPKTFNPIKDKLNTTFGSKIHGTIRLPNGETKPMNNIGKEIKQFGQRHNVWKLNTECSNKERKHPAQFPIKLVHDHIITWTNKNDIVLDCFMGSGTTGVACKELERKFIGIEIDNDYFNTAKERIENSLIQEKLNLEKNENE